MRQVRLAIALAALVLFAGSALAEEIIYFANGTSMPIRSHKVEDDMIMVDMGGDGFMGFPMEQIDRIEKAGVDVFLSPSSRKNQMFEPEVELGTDRRVQGRASGRHKNPEAMKKAQAEIHSQRNVPTNSDSGGFYRPFAGSGHAGKEAMRVRAPESTGSQQTVTRGGPQTVTSGNQTITVENGSRQNLKQPLLARPVPLDPKPEELKGKKNDD